MFMVTREGVDDLYVEAADYDVEDGDLVFMDDEGAEVGRVKAETWDAVVRPADLLAAVSTDDDE